MPKWQEFKTLFAASCCFQLFVITHGFRLDREHPPWVVDMAKAINRNLPEAEQAKDIEAIKKSVVTSVDKLDSGASDQFILFDWSGDSLGKLGANNNRIGGELYRLVYNRIEDHWQRTRQPLDIHFIGHSRGTYVNAAVIRRLSKNGDNGRIGFLQMTTLDPRGFANDGKLDANPGGIVDWTHNYYELDERLLMGRHLDNALNVNLTTIVQEWEGRQKINDNHSEVHDWLHWIYDLRDQSNEGDEKYYGDEELRPQFLKLRQQWQAGNPETRRLFYRGDTAIVENFNNGEADGFSLHGLASVKEKELELTPSKVHSGGSAFYKTPIPGDFTAEFTFRMVEPNDFAGADGLTFAMLDADTQQLGALGGQLGYAGLSGMAIAFDTYYNPEFGDQPKPWNQVSLRLSGSAQWQSFSANKVPEPLNSGKPFRVRITVEGTQLSITIYSFGSDQATFLKGPVPSMPLNKLIGFTAATGTGAQRHLIDDVIIVPGR